MSIFSKYFQWPGKSVSANIVKAMEDAYPPVAVTASAIAYEMFNSNVSKENLKRFCSDENLHISLMAINYLIYTQNKQPFIETIRTVHKIGDRDYNVKSGLHGFFGKFDTCSQ